MKALVVYFSQFGNTQKVAEGIAEGLASGASVRTIDVHQFGIAQLDGIELLVMGSPTHKMNLPEVVRPVLAQLPRRSLEGRWVAAFDTSYRMSRWLAPFTAARKLARQLRKLGGRQAAGPETFHVQGKAGPLYDGELVRAGAWARLVLQQAGGRGWTS
jgi:flavodoxin